MVLRKVVIDMNTTLIVGLILLYLMLTLIIYTSAFLEQHGFAEDTYFTFKVYPNLNWFGVICLFLITIQYHLIRWFMKVSVYVIGFLFFKRVRKG
jgi:hypothetical protein